MIDIISIKSVSRKIIVRKSPSPFFSYSMIRNLAVIMIVVLSTFGLNNIGSTDAYFTDKEVSGDNTYTAGEVDFTLSHTPYSSPETFINFMIEMPASTTIKVIPKDNSNPFWYHALSENFSNDIDFCQTLFLKYSFLDTENYSAPLFNFISSDTTSLNDWRMDIFTNTNSYNKICSFDFVYSVWQSRHNLPEFNAMGFSDTEKVGNIIASSGFRINRVYYDVDPTRGSEGDNEWVQIYNQTETALDISGWEICDNTSCDTIPPNTPLIPARGFGTITNASSTWNFWDMSSKVVKIVLGNDIGNGLANGGDRLILKRPDGVVIDEMNWKTDIGVWDPAATDVGEGHILGRKPDGYDTNQPNDFFDIFVPTIIPENPVDIPQDDLEVNKTEEKIEEILTIEEEKENIITSIEDVNVVVEEENISPVIVPDTIPLIESQSLPEALVGGAGRIRTAEGF